MNMDRYGLGVVLDDGEGAGDYWGRCCLSPLPLWIADQVRNDGVVVPRRPCPVD